MLGFGALGQFALGEGPFDQTRAVGSQWSQPIRKAGLSAAVIATTFVGFVPPPPAQAARTFTQFSQPQKKAVQQAPWSFNIAAPTTQTAIFTKFSLPQIPRVNLPDEQPSTLFEVAPPAQITIAFSPFSQPQFSRSVIPDEQPSTLFEVLPPQAPPFTGFARFGEYLPKTSVVFLYSAFRHVPFVIPADTHDGVYVKKKRKRHQRDPLDIEIEEKAKRRAAIELAVYGPEIVYSAPAPTLADAAPPAPANVEDLARIIMEARAQQAKADQEALLQDDEDVIDLILRDL